MTPFRLVAAIAVAVASSPAVAGQLDGVWSWDGLKYCERAAGTDAWPLVIKGPEWTGYEQSCTVTPRAGQYAMHCRGEGMEWDVKLDYVLSGDTLTVTEDGTTTTYTRCPE
jgi:hypothetical protein